jgi:hypothetical protein
MESFNAGAARRVVTPDPLLPVTSGAGPARPAEKQRMDLEVRAAVFAESGTRVAVVSMPFIGWTTRLCGRIREKVAGIPPENVLIGSTHTHTAPDPYGFPDENGSYSIDFDYLYGVCDAAADAVNAAAAALEPVRLKITTGEAEGKIAYNYYAPDLYDPRCHLLQALREDGSVLLTLVNYAIHPEILLQQHVCSPDLVGPLCEYIDENTGGTAIFMNSAQGGMVTADIRTPEGDKEEWSECVRIGRLLGSEALRLLEKAAPREAPGLWCSAQEITFPVNPMMGQMMSLLHPEATEDYDTPVTQLTAQQNLVNIGNAQILTIPGEALPNIGYYLKRTMRGKHNFLFGLTNDAFGYMMTSVDWNSFKAYEYISATSLSEMTGEILIGESLKLIEKSPAPGKCV